MNNQKYWRDRFQQLEAAQNQKGVAAYQEIEKQYRQAQREIEGKINTWYQRFAEKNGISMSEARKLLSNKELKELKWDINDYIKYGKENAITGNWQKELENASARFHITRLEALKLQTQQSLELLFGNQLDSIDATMKRIYLDGYYHTAYELQKGFRIGWDIAGLDQKQIEKVICKPWAVDGKNFSERIWSNKQKLISEVHKELTQNVLLGEDPQKAIDNIARKMNASKSNAGRLVMTEEAYFSSAAQKDCFHELGVEQYQIVATLDSHTSDICQSLDGQVFPMKDFEPGITAPPFHVWCRSTTVPYFDENFEQIGERAARDKEGKTYYVSDNMTYQEWKETFVNSGDESNFEWKKKPDENLIVEQKKILVKKQLELEAQKVVVQQQLDNFQIKTYSGICYNRDVTVADWENMNVAGKKEYYKNKIINETNLDLIQKYQHLYKQLEEYDIDYSNYYNIQQQLKKIEAEISQIQSNLKDFEKSDIIKIIDNDAYTQARKDAAMWAKSTKEADTLLRDKCGEVWRAAKQAERDAIYDYTLNSNKFNRPLSGFQGSWEQYYNKGIGKVDLNYEGAFKKIKDMTEIISQSTYDFDMWLQRGCSVEAIENFLHLSNGSLEQMTQEKLQQFLGRNDRIYSFTSTGVAKGTGLNGDVIMNIYAPQGTKMMYAEPFSASGNGDGKSWNGISQQSTFDQESEMIIQRGASYKITKIEKTSSKIFIDVEVHPEQGYKFVEDMDDYVGK